MDRKHGLALGEHTNPKEGHDHVINTMWGQPRPFTPRTPALGVTISSVGSSLPDEQDHSLTVKARAHHYPDGLQLQCPHRSIHGWLANPHNPPEGVISSS